MRDGLRRRHQQLRSAGETGATAIEIAILAPVLLMLVFGTIQAAVYYNARNVASTAAQSAVRYGGAETGTAGDGEAAARRLLREGAGTSLAGADVRVSRGGTVVTAEVTARVNSVVPFITFPAIHARAQGPVERVTR